MSGELTELHVLNPQHFQNGWSQVLWTYLPGSDEGYFRLLGLHEDVINRSALKHV